MRLTLMSEFRQPPCALTEMETYTGAIIQRAYHLEAAPLSDVSAFLYCSHVKLTYSNATSRLITVRVYYKLPCSIFLFWKIKPLVSQGYLRYAYFGLFRTLFHVVYYYGGTCPMFMTLFCFERKLY